jgi:hypothetical protein
VPIVPARIDYAQKLVTMGAPLLVGADLTSDMDVLRRFFEGGRGKYPDQASEIRLIEETAGPNGSRAT